MLGQQEKERGSRQRTGPRRVTAEHREREPREEAEGAEALRDSASGTVPADHETLLLSWVSIQKYLFETSDPILDQLPLKRLSHPSLSLSYSYNYKEFARLFFDEEIP